MLYLVAVMNYPFVESGLNAIRHFRVRKFRFDLVLFRVLDHCYQFSVFVLSSFFSRENRIRSYLSIDRERPRRVYLKIYIIYELFTRESGHRYNERHVNIMNFGIV